MVLQRGTYQAMPTLSRSNGLRPFHGQMTIGGAELEKARLPGPFEQALVVHFCMWKQLSLHFEAEARTMYFPVCYPNLVTLSITRPHCVCVCVCV
jgi:hypothetical protein